MSVKMYLSWRTKQRKFSPLGDKHHFLLLFCPPVRLHLHKREMGLYIPLSNITLVCRESSFLALPLESTLSPAYNINTNNDDEN